MQQPETLAATRPGPRNMRIECGRIGGKVAYIRIGDLIDGQDVGYWCKRYVEQQERADTLQAEVDDWEASFELYDRALRRGTEKWRDDPENPHDILPDTAKMMVWIVDQLDIKDDALKTAAIAMDMRAGWALTEDAYNRVMRVFGGGMAVAYKKICEALATIRVAKNKPEADK